MLERIEYFVDKVNNPLLKDIVTLGGLYPEPTIENCKHPNSWILIGWRDEFFKRWVVPGRESLLRAIWRIVIVKYEHCPVYRNMLDWIFMKFPASGWKPWNPNRQMECWRAND